MDVSLKWPACKIANIAQISQSKCGPFLVKMQCSQACVFWMWASSGLSGLFLVDIQLACGPDMGNRSGSAIIPHGMWAASGPRQFCYLGTASCMLISICVCLCNSNAGQNTNNK